jgi:hypothetical protein
MERQPTPEEVAEWRRRWDTVDPALIFPAKDLLIDGSRPNFRSHAQAWLNDYQRRATVRESRIRWAARLTLAMTVISAIAAIIAVAPVV